jgi:hypothetical protein
MNHRVGIVSMIALSSLLLCGAAPVTCKDNIGPSTGEVVGIAAGIGAGVVIGVVVLVEVNKSHHTVKGCVTSGPDGIQVVSDSDKRTYSLVSSPANVKVGDIVKLRGNKEKQPKGSTGNQQFVVEKISKDFGPCKAIPAPAAASTD